jgi:hypothetical protein
VQQGSRASRAFKGSREIPDLRVFRVFRGNKALWVPLVLRVLGAKSVRRDRKDVKAPQVQPDPKVRKVFRALTAAVLIYSVPTTVLPT